MLSRPVTLSLILAVLLLSCEMKNKLEDNAVIINIGITKEEAARGVVKTVRAPDGKYYDMKIPKGVKDRTPLKLPPRVARHYDYPLYFRVRFVEWPKERKSKE